MTGDPNEQKYIARPIAKILARHEELGQAYEHYRQHVEDPTTAMRYALANRFPREHDPEVLDFIEGRLVDLHGPIHNDVLHDLTAGAEKVMWARLQFARDIEETTGVCEELAQRLFGAAGKWDGELLLRSFLSNELLCTMYDEYSNDESRCLAILAATVDFVLPYVVAARTKTGEQIKYRNALRIIQETATIAGADPTPGGVMRANWAQALYVGFSRAKQP